MISRPAARRPLIRVAVVTYNSAKHIGTCLASLASGASDLEVFVADNCSGDESVSIARRSGICDTIICNATNLGFAAAANMLCENLGRADYVLLVNPDVTLGQAAIDALIALASQFPGAGLYGGRMTDPAGRLNPVSCLAKPTLWHALTFGLGLNLARGVPVLDPDSLGGWRRTGVRAVPVLTAGLILIDAAVWRRLGGFDEHFFLYGEDVDLCLRAEAQGAYCMFSDKAVYTHAAGASSATNAARQVLIMRGKASLYRRGLGGASRWVALGMLELGAGLRAGLERLVRPRDMTWRTVWSDRASWRSGW